MLSGRYKKMSRPTAYDKALNILIALAVCSVPTLFCDDHCPLYDRAKKARGCSSWNDDDVKAAVETILDERRKRAQETCVHAIAVKHNSIGEKIIFCDLTGEWQNFTLGSCYGNCESQRGSDDETETNRKEE